MGGQRHLTGMKKGANWIENQGENCYKMLGNCQMIDLLKN